MTTSNELLKKLERDYTDRKTVQDCLRSKARPSPEVKALLATDALDRATLQLAFTSILSSYISNLPENDNRAVVTRIGTVLRFVELVLILETNDASSRSPVTI